jgi:hypothetical protein
MSATVGNIDYKNVAQTFYLQWTSVVGELDVAVQENITLKSDNLHLRLDNKALHAVINNLKNRVTVLNQIAFPTGPVTM